MKLSRSNLAIRRCRAAGRGRPVVVVTLVMVLVT
jgi:hypothetical protein